MKRNVSHPLMILALTVGVPAACGAGLVDLGPAGLAAWAVRIGNDKPPCVADVSKDGTLAGGTDSGGHAFIWTAASGKVIIGTNVWLVGVDWLIVPGVSTNALGLANDNSAAYPLYWLGNADGTGGSWTSLPAMDGTSPWVATALGVKADGSDWWAAGYRNTQSDPYEYQLRYKNSSFSATSIQVAEYGHARSYFYAASDQGTFAGVAQYRGTAPDGGARNGEKWYAGINQPVNDWAVWCGPPEAGDGRQVHTDYTCIADAISGNGAILAGVNKNGAIWPALFWANNVYVYKLPMILISGSTYADWMGIRALNRNGTVMGGYYYTDPPTDAGPVEAFIFYLAGYNEGPPPDPDSVTGALLKVGDVLGTYGMDTNGWAFREVTGLSDDGDTLVGYGVTNGVIHTWLAQLPPPIVRITNITVGSGAVTIDFTSSGIGDSATYSFALQQSATLANGSTPFADVAPAAPIAGSTGSFQAIVPQTEDVQFYRIRHR